MRKIIVFILNNLILIPIATFSISIILIIKALDKKKFVTNLIEFLKIIKNIIYDKLLLLKIIFWDTILLKNWFINIVIIGIFIFLVTINPEFKKVHNELINSLIGVMASIFTTFNLVNGYNNYQKVKKLNNHFANEYKIVYELYIKGNYQGCLFKVNDLINKISDDKKAYRKYYRRFREYAGRCYYGISEQNNDEKTLFSSILCFEELYKETRDKKELAELENHIGVCYWQLFKLKKNKSYFEEAEKNLTEAKNKINKTSELYYLSILNNLGMLYNSYGQINNDKLYGIKALKLYKIAKNKINKLKSNNLDDINNLKISIFCNLSGTYRLLSQIKNKDKYINLSRCYLQKALTFIDIENSPLQYAHSIKELGDVCVYCYEGNYGIEQSLKYYKIALEILNPEDYPFDYALTMINMAIFMASQGDDDINKLDEAITYCNESLKIFKINKYAFHYANTHKLLGEINQTLFEKTLLEEYFRKSEESFNKALLVFTGSKHPKENNEVKANYQCLICRKNSVEQI